MNTLRLSIINLHAPYRVLPPAEDVKKVERRLAKGDKDAP